MTNDINEQMKHMIQMKEFIEQNNLIEKHSDDERKYVGEINMRNKILKLDYNNEETVETDKYKCKYCEFKTNWLNNIGECGDSQEEI